MVLAKLMGSVENGKKIEIMVQCLETARKYFENDIKMFSKMAKFLVNELEILGHSIELKH